MIKGHGDDIYDYKDIKANFSSNINPSGIGPELLLHLKNRINCIATYPQPLAEKLRELISESRDIPGKSLLITNGATESLYLAASFKPGGKTRIYIPSFAEYEDACRMYKHNIEFRKNSCFSINENFQDFNTVWIGNPNNPDGKIFEIETIKELARKNPQTLFIIDEAYIDFVKNPVSLVFEASQTKNLVVICSLTKRYAIPGLRLGYLAGHPDMVKIIEHQLMPWRINSMAIEAGVFCLSGEPGTYFKINEWLEESQKLQRAVDSLPKFDVLASKTTFFLVRSPVTASKLKQELAEKHQLLIRDASNFRGLTKYHFRVSIRTPKENQLLLNALKQCR
jgi:threonine-phosphate decarboxylase